MIRRFLASFLLSFLALQPLFAQDYIKLQGQQAQAVIIENVNRTQVYFRTVSPPNSPLQSASTKMVEQWSTNNFEIYNKANRINKAFAQIRVGTDSSLRKESSNPTYKLKPNQVPNNQPLTQGTVSFAGQDLFEAGQSYNTALTLNLIAGVVTATGLGVYIGSDGDAGGLLVGAIVTSSILEIIALTASYSGNHYLKSAGKQMYRGGNLSYAVSPAGAALTFQFNKPAPVFKTWN